MQLILPTAIEQLHQRLNIGSVGTEHGLIDARTGKHGFQLGFADFFALRMGAPCGLPAGEDPLGLTGFGVLHRNPADGGQLPIEWIGHAQCNEVVPPARLAQRLVKTFIPEVGNEECDGPLFHGGEEMFECRIDVGAFALGFHFDDFPNDAQDVGAGTQSTSSAGS